MNDEPRQESTGRTISEWRADMLRLLQADDVSVAEIADAAMLDFGLNAVDGIILARDSLAELLAAGAQPIECPYAECACEPITRFSGPPHEMASAILNEILAQERRPDMEQDAWLRLPQGHQPSEPR